MHCTRWLRIKSRIMGGYCLDLFLDQNIHDVNREFICAICHDVLKNPTMSESCAHIYCATCIEEWTHTSNTCPIDRKPITRLVIPIRPFMNLYNEIKLKCGFKGCGIASTLEQIESHINSCNYNPEAIKPCVHNCGASIAMKDIAAHNCLDYLKEEVITWDALVVNLRQELENKVEQHATQLNSNGVEITRLKIMLSLKNFDFDQSEMLLNKANVEIAELKNQEKFDKEKIRKLQLEVMELKNRKKVVVRGKNVGRSLTMKSIYDSSSDEENPDPSSQQQRATTTNIATPGSSKRARGST